MNADGSAILYIGVRVADILLRILTARSGMGSGRSVYRISTRIRW